jgi:hypothetical protein
MGITATDYDSYRTLEEAIAALEDLYATGKVLPSEQARIEHRPGEPGSYVIVIGGKSKSSLEQFRQLCARTAAGTSRGVPAS